MKVSELKVIFDIFIEKLDENKEIINANQKMFEATQHLMAEKESVLSAIDKKIETIARYHPKVTYHIPELENFKAQQKEIIALHERQLASLFDAFKSNISEELRKNSKDKLKLYIFIFCLVLLLSNFLFLWYGIDQHKRNKDLELISQIYRSNAEKGAEFITEKGLEKDFKKCLDKQP